MDVLAKNTSSSDNITAERGKMKNNDHRGNTSPKQQNKELKSVEDEKTADALLEKAKDTTESPEEYRILIIGKTGNGKSSLGNTITGKNHFPVGRGMITTTTEPKVETAYVQGKLLKVIDTPDLNNPHLTPEEKKKQVLLWKSLVVPAPTAILLAVRFNIRYTDEERTLYREIKDLWGDSEQFCKRLIVAVTFGDQQHEGLGNELQSMCRELTIELNCAENRYVIFHNKADDSVRRKDVDVFLHKLKTVQRILIIGKTGNGKSSLGNIIAGKNVFLTGRGMVRKTREASAIYIPEKDLQVVDTPDISSMTDKEKHDEILHWKNMTAPRPDAILLAVRCDIRYTAEELAIYQEIKKLWGNEEEFCQNLVLAFTFGDRQDENLDDVLEAVRQEQSMCQALTCVLNNAAYYILFDKKSTEEEKQKAVKQLLYFMENKNQVNDSSATSGIKGKSLTHSPKKAEERESEKQGSVQQGRGLLPNFFRRWDKWTSLTSLMTKEARSGVLQKREKELQSQPNQEPQHTPNTVEDGRTGEQISPDPVSSIEGETSETSSSPPEGHQASMDFTAR